MLTLLTNRSYLGALDLNMTHTESQSEFTSALDLDGVGRAAARSASLLFDFLELLKEATRWHPLHSFEFRLNCILIHFLSAILDIFGQ